MNERIEKLMLEAGKTIPGNKQIDADFCEKFAQLVAKDVVGHLEEWTYHINESEKSLLQAQFMLPGAGRISADICKNVKTNIYNRYGIEE